MPEFKNKRGSKFESICEMELNKIYNENCLVTMGKMQDKSVDLVLADYPYGKGMDYEDFVDTKENAKKLIDETISEILRVGKFVMITCGTDRTHLYPSPSDIFCIYQPANASYSLYGHITWQPILVYGDDPQKSLKNKWMTIRNTEPSSLSQHPCPKPKYLWMALIRRGTDKPNTIVYDPFIGSGTTAIACLALGRKFIGSEISSKYVDIANERISLFKKQGKLFNPFEAEQIQQGMLF